MMEENSSTELTGPRASEFIARHPEWADTILEAIGKRQWLLVRTLMSHPVLLSFQDIDAAARGGGAEETVLGRWVSALAGASPKEVGGCLSVLDEMQRAGLRAPSRRSARESIIKAAAGAIEDPALSMGDEDARKVLLALHDAGVLMDGEEQRKGGLGLPERWMRGGQRTRCIELLVDMGLCPAVPTPAAITLILGGWTQNGDRLAYGATLRRWTASGWNPDVALEDHLSATEILTARGLGTEVASVRRELLGQAVDHGRESQGVGDGHGGCVLAPGRTVRRVRM